MFARWLNRLIPSRNQRVLNSWRPLVVRVGDLEERMRDTTNADFKGCRARWREQLDQGAKLDDLLVEVYASVREVARRRTGMRHFDAQVLGGIALHNGKIGEMATGEGKTLVATLPAVLNSLNGGTHIITVNEYLAQRDSQWMGEIYRGLGLEVATVFSEMKPEFRRQAYQADITYGTNSEFGFDYLRDNMCLSREAKVQGTLNFAIVDEVDSILIDEARTPLIISGVLDDDPGRYIEIDRIVARLQRAQSDDDDGDFTLDEKNKRAHLSESGQEQTENMLREAGLIKGSLYDPLNTVWLHHLDAALRARFLYHKDVDYVVRDGRVHIVDVFTGRIMHGRRWSSGLHQAVEAKEGAAIQPESQTLASITLQNYFRMYDKLSGMTGTASTEAPEFMQIYGVEVVTIPTNKPNIRLDNPDRVFLTLEEKYDAIVEEIHDRNLDGQPVLVGTVSIENSELISAKLKALGVKHMVLNAKQHEQESFIVANAGNFGAVTIATNMAGRGTDIVLGGNLNDRLQAAAGAKQLDDDAKSPTDGIEKIAADAMPAADDAKSLATGIEKSVDGVE
ncbi:MAG: preprotein translocase subunit SecA, partial [Proteobacteria bacterium]|nr:preprotein translocase subunit SecA [Pseudomonadota bacterium]